MDIHLDLVGGIAGDMFIAALLDAFPEHERRVFTAIAAVDEPGRATGCELLAHRDSVLCGHRFQVTAPRPTVGPTLRPAAHAHTTWSAIRRRLADAPLAPAVRTHAHDIFQLLADAEAQVHGVSPDQVSFHEVGAWDSIADIVGAAALIEVLGASRWSTSPAPLGSGRVRSAHGVLPVPAPATARLLQGMLTIDDGIGGERVTPTGAAILRHLCPPERGVEGLGADKATAARTLGASGIGFGTRVLPGISNHLRVLCFAPQPTNRTDRTIEVLEFEIDDQSGEDLAAGLDRLRLRDAVLDVTQTPVFGKKGRMMVHVRVLVRQGHLAETIEACFRETTTIGMRHRTVHGIALERRSRQVVVDGRPLRVKVVDRPGGPTAKAESDDVLCEEAHARRAALRSRAEDDALNLRALDV